MGKKIENDVVLQVPCCCQCHQSEKKEQDRLQQPQEWRQGSPEMDDVVVLVLVPVVALMVPSCVSVVSLLSEQLLALVFFFFLPPVVVASLLPLLSSSLLFLSIVFESHVRRRLPLIPTICFLGCAF